MGKRLLLQLMRRKKVLADYDCRQIKVLFLLSYEIEIMLKNF